MQLRKALRSATYPQSSSEPKRYRASCLAKWFWCAEQSRHLALGLIPEEVIDVAEIGTIGHKILEESLGKRFPWENQFIDELAKYQDKDVGFMRDFEDAKIYCNLSAHFDDLQITKDLIVSVVEHKFVMNANLYNIQRWKLCMASFQSQIYSWILQPIVEELGGIMHRVNVACFWSLETFEHIHDFDVEYKPVQTQENILRCVKAYEDPRLIIAPTEWKCRYCSQLHKELCQFEAKNKQTIQN